MAETGAQTVTLNSRCRQRFASTQGEAAFALREAGIILAGFNEMVAPWEVRRDAPDFHVVFFGLKGEGWVKCRGRRCRVQGQDAWVLPAGEPHAYGIGKVQPWKLFWFHLENADPWRHLSASDRELCLAEREHAELPMLLDGYIRESAIDRGSARKAAAAYAQLLVYNLRQLLIASSDPVESASDELLDRLWLDVQNHLDHDWKIPEMATRAHCSSSHFHRMVLKRYGVSPKQLLLKFRMERARVLVRHPDYTLDSIAELIGYQSGFALSRAFKAWHGVAPAHYRKGREPSNGCPIHDE